MKALVLCAGRGERLGALTRETPKAMLPIGGEPLLGHTLRYLRTNGFDEIAVNVHFCGDAIASYVRDGAQFGVRVHIEREPALLGTAGSVRRLAPFFADVESFLVLYGDLLIDQSLAPMLAAHRSRGAAATLLLHRRSTSNSVVGMDGNGRITTFLERPTEDERRACPGGWVNSGVQILSRAILGRIPEQTPADLPRDVYSASLARGDLFGLPLTGYRCAIDSAERYAQAQSAFADGSYRRPCSPGPGRS